MSVYNRYRSYKKNTTSITKNTLKIVTNIKKKQIYSDTWNENPFSAFEHDEDETIANMKLLKDLQLWAPSYNIRHSAVKELLKILNKRLSDTLPKDPRTLLKATPTVSLNPFGDGQYWHHGFKPCIEKAFSGSNKHFLHLDYKRK